MVVVTVYIIQSLFCKANNIIIIIFQKKLIEGWSPLLLYGGMMHMAGVVVAVVVVELLVETLKL